MMLIATLLSVGLHAPLLGSSLTRAHLAIGSARTRAALASSVASVPAEATAALDVCRKAAREKTEDPEAVCDALLQVEQQMRAAAKDDGGALSRATLDSLDGAWRLVFTTGTIDTQSKLGRKINYFPLRATQSFDTRTKAITNGIYVGEFALLKFFGTFDWLEDRRRLEFDFDSIAVLGFKFDLPTGGAEELGAATGLGSKNNVQRSKKGKKAFFVSAIAR